jgi:transcriptional regulator with XRE-family HTH domain
MQALSHFSGIEVYDAAMTQGRPAKRQRSTFGQRLYELREAATITQAAIAERLGVSQRTYSDWERGSVAFTPSRLSELATILGVDPATLLGQPKARKVKPAGGRLGELFNEITSMPRRKQAQIAAMLEDAVTAHKARVAG